MGTAQRMNATRKVTVSAAIRFTDMAMESTDAALEVVKSVVAELEHKCGSEIKQALEDAGAKDVTVQLTAY